MGSCNSEGKCVCDYNFNSDGKLTGYIGDSCNSCDNVNGFYYNIESEDCSKSCRTENICINGQGNNEETCTASNGTWVEKTCSNGTCNQTGDCICHSDDVNGYFKNDGGLTCNVCQDNYYPPTGDNACTVYCTDSTTCNDNGVCDQDTGLCICDDKFDGANCNICKDDFYPKTGSNMCQTECNSESTCNGNGSCNDVGICLCYQDYEKNGFWENDQNGNSCNVCSEHYYPSDGENACINYCNNEQNTCGDNGTCDTSLESPQGNCICNRSNELGYWDGDKCDYCLQDYYGLDCKVMCISGDNSSDNNSNKIGCNGNGVCITNFLGNVKHVNVEIVMMMDILLEITVKNAKIIIMVLIVKHIVMIVKVTIIEIVLMVHVMLMVNVFVIYQMI